MATILSRALRALPLVAMLVPATASAQWTYATNYPPYPYGAPESSLKIEIKPRDASVYVDGYYAGIVDDFDGTFQRLHVIPGQHEVTIYMRGYRTLKQQLYLSPHRTRTIRASLEQLGAGEAQEPEPVPVEPREPEAGYERGGRPAPFPEMPPDPADPRARPYDPRVRPADPEDQPDDPRAPLEPAPPSAPSRFGTVSIRVQPSGATIVIDGERRDGPLDDEHLLLQLTPGQHTIEVEKDGYRRSITEVDVTANRTANVSITLSRE